MNAEESLARRLCFEVGGFDPDEITANDVPRWRRYAPMAQACFAWWTQRERADSLLTFDLRAFAQNYAGTPFGSRCKTAADELDRLYEVERRYEASLKATISINQGEK